MKESYDKRFNLLIRGLDESNDSAWEKAEEILEIVYNFMKEGLQIEEPSSIPLVDYHRLPQRPVYKNNVKVNRPIIIKLSNAYDKRQIFSRLKYLKS